MKKYHSHKKYREMNKFRVRIGFNSMGERTKSRVCIDNEHRQEGGRHLQSYSSTSHSPVGKSRSIKRMINRGNQVNDPLHSVSTLTRVIRVLREILFGKVGRNIVNPDKNNSSLLDVLKFYCTASFGAMTIAEERRSEIFHTILALQSSSSFLRVMKRLLHIPGIKPYHHNISDIYFEIWVWLIENDALFEACNENGIPRTVVTTTMFQTCIECVGSTKGKIFSPTLFSILREDILGQEICPPPHLDQQYMTTGPHDRNESGEWIDIDRATESILHLVEEFEEKVGRVEEELFPIKRGLSVIISPSNSKTTKIDLHMAGTNGRSFSKYQQLLMSSKSILHEFIALDKNRDGILKDTILYHILKVWYEKTFNNVYLNTTQFEFLYDYFGKERQSIDYILFFGLFSTFVNEEHSIPSIETLENYMRYAFRGVDRIYLNLIRDYVQISCLKMTSKEFTREKVTMSTRQRIINSRRALSRLRPYPNRSDFFTQWVGSASYLSCDGSPDLTSTDKLESNTSLVELGNKFTAIHNPRPKTPLHLVQPLNNFVNESISQNKDNVDTRNKKENYDSGGMVSTVCLGGLQGGEPKDAVRQDLFGTNIYMRFPEVEPQRTAMNSRDSGHKVVLPMEGQHRQKVIRKEPLPSFVHDQYTGSCKKKKTFDTSHFDEDTRIGEHIPDEEHERAEGCSLDDIRTNLSTNESNESFASLTIHRCPKKELSRDVQDSLKNRPAVLGIMKEHEINNQSMKEREIDNQSAQLSLPTMIHFGPQLPAPAILTKGSLPTLNLNPHTMPSTIITPISLVVEQIGEYLLRFITACPGIITSKLAKGDETNTQFNCVVRSSSIPVQTSYKILLALHPKGIFMAVQAIKSTRKGRKKRNDLLDSFQPPAMKEISDDDTFDDEALLNSTGIFVDNIGIALGNVNAISVDKGADILTLFKDFVASHFDEDDELLSLWTIDRLDWELYFSRNVHNVHKKIGHTRLQFMRLSQCTPPKILSFYLQQQVLHRRGQHNSQQHNKARLTHRFRRCRKEGSIMIQQNRPEVHVHPHRHQQRSKKISGQHTNYGGTKKKIHPIVYRLR